MGNDATDSDAVGGVTGSYTLTGGQTNNTVDAGFYLPVALGDFIWKDVNCDGQQDAGEPGLSGVTVNLLNSSNVIIATTTTNASGLYAFTGLPPGSYSVQFATPAGYTPTLANVGNDATDSDAVGGVTSSYTLTSGQTNNAVDAGFCPISSPAALGDFVWNPTSTPTASRTPASQGSTGATNALWPSA